MTISIDTIWQDYAPPGPVAAEYMTALHDISAIMGPFGSGKTTASFMRGLLLSTFVPPSPVDGVRYAKGVVLRRTYRELEETTIETFKQHFPPEWGSFTGGSNAPGESVIDFDLPDGTRLHQEITFAAIGENNVKSFTDGFEATWCFINGVDSMPPDILTYMFGRLGRWPAPMHRAADWEASHSLTKKLFCDMNAPDMDNFTYEFFEEKKLGKLFKQPSGLSPAAENIKGVGKDYYPAMARNNGDKKWWIRRFVENKFGYSRDGQPVYENWDDTRHVAPARIPYNPRKKLVLGFDAGGNPAMVGGQRTLLGGLNVLFEFVPGKMGSQRFGRLASQFLAENFPGAEMEGWADPTAANMTQDTPEEETVWLDTVSDCIGVMIKPAAGNNRWDPRFNAVDGLLTKFFEGQAMMQLDPERCPVLRRGFNSGYRWGKTTTHGSEVLSDRPVKDKHSNPHDALQYLALGSCDYYELTHREGASRGRTLVEVGGWD